LLPASFFQEACSLIEQAMPADWKLRLIGSMGQSSIILVRFFQKGTKVVRRLYAFLPLFCNNPTQTGCLYLRFSRAVFSLNLGRAQKKEAVKLPPFWN
jgi:hypothetical protein